MNRIQASGHATFITSIVALSIIFLLTVVSCGTPVSENTTEEKPADIVPSGNTATDNAATNNTYIITLPTGTEKIEIRDVAVTNIQDRSLTVTWKTNVPSTSELLARPANSVSSIGNWPDNNLVLEHKVILINLEPSTTYTLLIKSKDASGNQATLEIGEPYKTRSIRVSTEMAVGDPAPDFSLKSITGESINLSDLRGKWVMIVFWMTSCDACKQEIKYLNTFQNNNKFNDFLLLSINVGEKDAFTVNYIIGQKLKYPVLLDEEKEVSEKYTIAHFPTAFLIDPKGNFIKINEATFKNESEIYDFVQSAIQSK
ncbi:MAG: redoxin domain-containing protein [Dehalococcoidia bacterium]|nr:redoxin domain-containing protein [Dehalococcoidia bacterium]